MALSGCAQRAGWVRADTSEQQRKADVYTCERDARMAEGGWAMFRRCMDAKGYTKP